MSIATVPPSGSTTVGRVVRTLEVECPLCEGGASTHYYSIGGYNSKVVVSCDECCVYLKALVGDRDVWVSDWGTPQLAYPVFDYRNITSYLL